LPSHLRRTRAAIAPLEPGWAVIEEIEAQPERPGARRAVPSHLDRIGSRSCVRINFNSDFGLIWLFPKEAIAEKWDPLTMETL
jgi:hypothetical protein